MAKTKVAIYVRGGVVQEVRTNCQDVDVKMFDVDNLAEEFSGQQIDQKWDRIKKEYPTVVA